MKPTYKFRILSESTLLALVGLAFRLSIGSPPPAVPKEERSKGVDPRGYSGFARYTLWVYQLLICGVMTCEAISLMIRSRLLALPEENLIYDLHNRSCPPSYASTFDSVEPGLSTLAVIGCLISISGSLFRLWSRRSLGRFFTWEISILPGHKLYTKGPYSIVRHPSYSGFFVSQIGLIIFLCAPQTFMTECVRGMYPSGFMAWMGCMVGYLGVIVVGGSGRTSGEDQLLKKEFGKEWEDWAGRTGYRLFPGVF